jgi:hypothetical protein
MTRIRTGLALLVAVLLAARAAAQAPPLLTAVGKVDKVEKETVSVQPRGADGRYQKSVMMRLTGTSKLSLLSFRDQGGKKVVVQRDMEFRDLQPGQLIGVLYTATGKDGKDGFVLLSAVAEPAER